MKKTVVIYHKADFDGIFCREIAKKFLPDAELIGWDYGDPVPELASPGADQFQLYMMDISIDQLMSFPGLIWIDHHKTAIAKYFSLKIPGYRIDGVAACRLAWQWFAADARLKAQSVFPEKHVEWMAKYPLPQPEDFIDRKVQEPWAVRLAGEFDVWDKRDPDADLFQHGLRSRELTENIWELILQVSQPAVDGKEDIADITVQALLDAGEAIQYAKTKENEGIIKQFGFTIQFEGFCLLACNAARYNSQLFTAGLKPEHDGMLGFNWDGQKEEWRVSLYTDKPGVDLSPVAVKYGGGGHKSACGFRTDRLPFL